MNNQDKMERVFVTLGKADFCCQQKSIIYIRRNRFHSNKNYFSYKVEF